MHLQRNAKSLPIGEFLPVLVSDRTSITLGHKSASPQPCLFTVGYGFEARRPSPGCHRLIAPEVASGAWACRGGKSEHAARSSSCLEFSGNLRFGWEQAIKPWRECCVCAGTSQRVPPGPQVYPTLFRPSNCLSHCLSHCPMPSFDLVVFGFGSILGASPRASILWAKHVFLGSRA